MLDWLPHFDAALAARIERDFRERLPTLGALAGRAVQVMEALGPEGRVPYQFLVACMPEADAAVVPYALFADAVRTALRARHAFAWARAVDGIDFLDHVVTLRINNEPLSDHRRDMLDALQPLIAGLDAEEAAQAVNRWCLSRATYRSTDDRTASPLAVLTRTYGRCGEESVLLTAALRSMGLAARQVYAPKWAHCDDNHAWVEVRIDGAWHYLGACEPSPRLDMGWFTGPAARAMLVHARTFSPYGADTAVYGSTRPVHTARTALWHLLPRYAQTRPVIVQVWHPDGKPAVDVTVRFCLANDARMAPIAELPTDRNGRVTFVTGLGDLQVEVVTAAGILEQRVDVRLVTEPVAFTLPAGPAVAGTVAAEGEAPGMPMSTVGNGGKEPELPMATILADYVPPEAVPAMEPVCTPEEWAANREVIDRSNQARQAIENGFLRGERAEAFASAFPANRQAVARLVAAASGNHPAIATFLQDASAGSLEERIALLETLTEKDLSDVTEDVLRHHLLAAGACPEGMEPALWRAYVLCPRVHHEPLSAWREALRVALSPEEQARFRREPAQMLTHVASRIRPTGPEEPSNLFAPPDALLRHGIGNAASRLVLAVAWLRALGIPARRNAADGLPEIWVDGGWQAHDPDTGARIERSGALVVVPPSDAPAFAYGAQVTVSRWVNGYFEVLATGGGLQADGSLRFAVQPGLWRVMTNGRLPDGTAAVWMRTFPVAAGETVAVEAVLRTAPLHEASVAQAIVLPEIRLAEVTAGVTAEDGKTMLNAAGKAHLDAVPMNTAMEAVTMLAGEGRPSFLAFVAPGEEPTAHLLHEMREAAAAFQACAARCLLLPVRGDAGGMAVLRLTAEQTGVRVRSPRDPGHAVEAVVEALGKPALPLPLVLFLDGDGRCAHHLAGYNVGTGGLLLRHLNG